MTDVFLYNAGIERGLDLEFIRFVNENKSSERLKLILVTGGGSPDAAYKMGRYIQSRYDDIEVFVPGWCKSAGTLLAIAANQIIFSPYGELGPLDVQMTKTDKIAGLDSGLNITEALMALENRASTTFHKLVYEIIASSDGIVSFHTASHSASEIVASLYGPVFGRIDPEEVGSRARAMRIGEDYGKRLNQHFQNLKPGSLEKLSSTYSSHGFVIDLNESRALFQRVREANEHEKALVTEFGDLCRKPNSKPCIMNVTDKFEEIAKAGEENEKPKQNSEAKKAAAKPRAVRKRANGKNSSGAKRA